MRQRASVAPRNTLGVIGFTLALLSLPCAHLPLAGAIAWPLVSLGLLLAALGLLRVRANGGGARALAVTGIAGVVGAAVAVGDIRDSVATVPAVAYELSGNAKDLQIAYGAAGNLSTERLAAPPWRKTLAHHGPGSLTATTGAEGGAVTCKITVDGRLATTRIAGGPFATVTCTAP